MGCATAWRYWRDALVACSSSGFLYRSYVLWDRRRDERRHCRRYAVFVVFVIDVAVTVVNVEEEQRLTIWKEINEEINLQQWGLWATLLTVGIPLSSILNKVM